MRFPRERFTLRKMMVAIVFLAVIMTVIVQNAQIQRGRAREEQLRASLAKVEARAAWVDSINEWHRVGDSPALKKQWADGMRRAEGSMPR